MQNSDGVSLLSYFKREKKFLILTAVTGIIYNVGMTAGPWFEGQLAQYLYDILKGTRNSRDIVILSAVYALVIAGVQSARALKRLFVRRFANDVSLSMKESIFHHLVHESYEEIRHEDSGAVMTRAVADAEACAEGMRKFTTELFDTGVVMISYFIMLMCIDWRMTFIVILFPPAAYIISAALKKRVTESAAESREAMSALNNAAADCAEHALTYRIYGEDGNRAEAYERVLENYEKKNVAAGIWQNSPQPVYFVISMISVIPILYFGSRNVTGHGWALWTIASFSSFLSCFTKLATKSSHAANLFNAVQKAQVSWERIRHYLDPEEEKEHAEGKTAEPAELKMEHVDFSYGEGRFSLSGIHFTADPGEIVGITGKVASGKSTFGRLFLNELPYSGTILYGGRDIRESDELIFAYAGHNPELFTGTVKENITFGNSDEERLARVLREVDIDNELSPDTPAGMEGSGLSGGQQARIALARALYSRAPVLILDDPFASVDPQTEEIIFRNLRAYENDRIILLISHRLAVFPRTDRVVFIENGTARSGTHEEMMHMEGYASLYALQSRGGGEHA